MSKRKYITSGGLAFFEEKDMEKLHYYSLKGWHVKAFNLMGYTLEKGEKSSYLYNIDYQKLKKGEKEDYFNLFSLAKWDHVTSAGNMHLFRAESGTPPIYTDQETTIEKYAYLSHSIMKLTVPFVLITILAWLFTMVTSGILNTLFSTLAIIFSVIAIPTIGTLFASYYNKWKEAERNFLVKLVKYTPIGLITFAFIGSLFWGGKNVTLDIVMSMVIGAIGFPMLISMVMVFYSKIKKKV